jgi:transcription initiation factor TFIID subunit TAF12
MVQKGQLPPQAYIPDFQIPPEAQQVIQQQQMAQMGQQGALAPQKGVGDASVNTIDASNTPPTASSPESVQAQSKQLLGQVPLQ